MSPKQKRSSSAAPAAVMPPPSPRLPVTCFSIDLRQHENAFSVQTPPGGGGNSGKHRDLEPPTVENLQPHWCASCYGISCATSIGSNPHLTLAGVTDERPVAPDTSRSALMRPGASCSGARASSQARATGPIPAPSPSC